MAKRCAHCGHLNESERLFCAMCGEPLDANLQLIKNLEKMSKAAPKKTQPVQHEDEDVEIPKFVKKEEKSHAGVWITLGILVIVAAVGAWWMFLR